MGMLGWSSEDQFFATEGIAAIIYSLACYLIIYLYLCATYKNRTLLGIFPGFGITSFMLPLLSVAADCLTVLSFARKEEQLMVDIILALGVVADKDLYT